jgi:hypothetical protein
MWPWRYSESRGAVITNGVRGGCFNSLGVKSGDHGNSHCLIS